MQVTNCSNCQHKMERIFDKCHTLKWVNGKNFDCAFYEPMENINGKEISSGQGNTVERKLEKCEEGCGTCDNKVECIVTKTKK